MSRSDAVPGAEVEDERRRKTRWGRSLATNDAATDEDGA